MLLDVLHLVEALALKGRVADGEDLVDDQDLGFEMGGDREGETDVHSTRAVLTGSTEKLLDLGEGNNLIQIAINFRLPHAEEGGAEIDVLATCKLGVEAGSHLEQGG